MVSKIKKQETEEEKFIRLFNLGFEQVVAPAMESMEEELRLEMKGLKKEMGGLKEETEGLKKEMKQGFKRVNAKIDSHDRRTDNLETQIGDHEKRIKNLESKRGLTA
ncbi:hypothetical protein HYW44_04500 [Candidatus Daviesbacteria bacterium]|nr:hypothetical protein [Candidatus Daviesbacteria bacterium]